MPDTSTPIPLGPASAPDQTATASPLGSWDLNVAVDLVRVEQREARFPTLQSFSVGQTQRGEWVLIGGRTNGLHGFSGDGTENFPPSQQNTTIWIYDPVTDRSWSRPLSESGLSADIQLSMSTTNAQDFQQGDVLYRAGGYVYDGATQTFETRNRLTAIDLGDLAAWAKGNQATVKQGTVLSVAGEAMDVNSQETGFFAVTGGEMLQGARRHQAQLIFGQDFSGGYTPGSNGLYTEQVRDFDIIYKRSHGLLSYKSNGVSEPDADSFRRRDLNIVTSLERNDDGKLVRSGTALGGVFFEGSGVWTVPVEIDLLTGQPVMADPTDPGTFRQALNQYTAADLALYSRATDSQSNLIFGGISAITLDPAGNPYYVNQGNDPNLAPAYPFTSQIAAITHHADDTWTQSIVGSFPALSDGAGDPLTFGASSVFIPIAKGSDRRVRYLADGVLDLDWLDRRTDPGTSVLVGYVVGGIESQVFSDFNDLTTYGSSNYTLASGEIFKVMITAL